MFVNYATLDGLPFVRIGGRLVAALLIIPLLKYFKGLIMMILLIYGAWVCLLTNFWWGKLLSIIVDANKLKDVF